MRSTAKKLKLTRSATKNRCQLDTTPTHNKKLKSSESKPDLQQKVEAIRPTVKKLSPIRLGDSCLSISKIAPPPMRIRQIRPWLNTARRYPKLLAVCKRNKILALHFSLHQFNSHFFIPFFNDTTDYFIVFFRLSFFDGKKYFNL